MSLRAFINDESGAITVDWIVLAAGCLALGVYTTQSTTAAMANLSVEVAGELAQDDLARNFFDDLAAGLWMDTYEPVAVNYGNMGQAAGVNWAQIAYAGYSAFDDATLMSHYQADYDLATTGTANGSNQAARAMDHIAVQEQVMRDRGMTVPAGNLSAAQVRAQNT